MKEDTFLDEDRVKEFWETCKSTFYTEDQIKALIKQAIKELVDGV